MKTNTSMTLYSRSVVNGAEVWTRSVIPAVQWEERIGVNLVNSANLQIDRVTVYIPDMSVAVKSGDVIVRGTNAKNITPTYTMRDMRGEYQAYTVREAARQDYGSLHLRHIEVGAN